MYLKSLELHGFKSFPERTLLKFNQGATIIVGPNGSGKSNITDAMRWVLGELSSKNIRGSKMEDVIFAGANDKKAMSFAEVSVTFDDSAEPKVLQSPYDEITVTRRFFRSGDSEYYINGKKSRLKDIYELFMNTGIGREGYSIIGQGKIAEIISKKSDDRRGVFEESAGIAKFRYKKNESERKLEQTTANMDRVSDIERELEGRIGPLERDSEKAKKFLEYFGEKKKTDISLWIYDAARLKTLIQKTEDDARLSEHELEMAEDTSNVLSGKIERLYEQSHNNKEASRRNYEETTGATKMMNAAEAESRVLEKDKLNSEKQLENEKKLLESTENSRVEEENRLSFLKSRLDEIKAEREKVQTELDGVVSDISSLEERIGEKTAALDDLLAEKQEAETKLQDLNVRMNVLENNISTQKQRSENIFTDIKKYEDEISALEKIISDAQATVDDYNAEINKINEKLSSVNSETEKLSAEFDSLDEQARAKKAEIDSFDSRISALSAMLEHFDGYNYSVKHIMSEAKNGRLSGIRGPLSHLISVDEKYVTAIETSLGAAMQNIVTEDENAAKKSIELLKRNNAGRATFYPLTTVKPLERGHEYDGLEHTRGFIGWADELVKSDSEYRNIVKSLLGRVVVYDNLDNATSSARAKNWKIRAVTLDGQQINAGGSFTGGQTKRDSGMLSRTSQIESLKSEREKAQEELSEIQKKEQKIRDEIDGITSSVKSEEERRGLMTALANTEISTISDAEGQRKAISDLVEGMKADAENLDKTSSRSAEDLERLKELIIGQTEHISAITGTRDEIAGERGELELLLAEKQEKANNTRITFAELTRDVSSTEESINDTTGRFYSLCVEVDNHKKAVDELNISIKLLGESSIEKLREAEEIKEKIEGLTGLKQKLEEAGDDIEKQIGELRQQEREQSAKKDLVFMAHSKNVSKLESLKSEDEKLSAKIWDDYELTYGTAVKFAEENDCHTIVDGEKTKFVALQTELKNKIKGLGHVNVEAIEEYKNVKERYEYIKGQLDDLRKSKEELEKIISGIEAEMTKKFLEAFDKINTYFGEVFRELFGGGHAEVVLTDPEHALESGIEINAAPPGKMIKNLNLLSGGEQAFIAIALMFALIKVNPSPFCIFDEIEAALDEVNVTRVGRYIKRYSKEMQIIMISHRRGTMDIADTLYGVTMPQSGVSKVFTLGAGDDKETLLK